MSNHTFTPGSRVVHDATGVCGTLTSTNGVSAVVQWDAAGVAMPADILPVADIERAAPAGLEAFTDAEIQAELDRRKDEAYEAARVTAVEYLQETPELTTPKTTVTQLFCAARDAGIDASAMFEAYGIVTDGTSL